MAGELDTISVGITVSAADEQRTAISAMMNAQLHKIV